MRSLLLLLFLLSTVAPYNILVYNIKFGHSHVSYLGRLADTLVEAGHNVTTLSPGLDGSVAEGTKKSHLITIPTSEEAAPLLHQLHNNPNMNFFTVEMNAIVVPLFVGPLFSSMFAAQCKRTLEEPGLVERLRDAKFDVFINENFDYCGTGLAHVIQPKALVTVSTTGLFETTARDLGIPFPGSYMPGFMTAQLDPHSIVSRARNMFNIQMNQILFDQQAAASYALFNEKFGPDYPSMAEITRRSAFVFTNTEPLLDYAYPTLKKIVDLGGLNMRPALPLDKYWNDILSRRKESILVSFGSVAKSIKMPPGMKLKVLEGLSLLTEYTVIWKYEDLEDDFVKNHASKVKNLVLTKWMPQNDLLDDKRIVAFVSHAGAGSTQEAALRGMPTLFVPLFAEQPRNAAVMQRSGMAKVYSKHDLMHPEKFAAAIRDVAHDNSLRKRAAEISAMLAARPFTPKELLIKHVEFAAKFGSIESLNPDAQKLNFIQVHNLDIYLIAFLLLIVLPYTIIKACVRRCCFKQTDKKKTD